jgi:multiple sugar transport system permease protein
MRPRASARRPHRADALFVWIMLGPAILVLAGFYVYPTAYSAWISLTDLSLLHLRQGGAFVGLANYKALLSDRDVWLVIWRTVFWLTAVSVVVRVLLALGLALLLESVALRRYKLRTVTRLALIVPWATPPIVAVATWRWMLNPQAGGINRPLQWLGVLHAPLPFLADTLTVWPAIVLIIVWNTLPVATLSFVAALQSVPRELVEAAALDGAGRFGTFRSVTLPHILPTVIIVTLLLVFWTFNNFVYVWLTTGGGPGRFTNVLATEVYIRGFVDFQLGPSATIGMIMAIFMGLFGLLYSQVGVRRALAGRL